MADAVLDYLEDLWHKFGDLNYVMGYSLVTVADDGIELEPLLARLTPLIIPLLLDIPIQHRPNLTPMQLRYTRIPTLLSQFLHLPQTLPPHLLPDRPRRLYLQQQRKQYRRLIIISDLRHPIEKLFGDIE